MRRLVFIALTAILAAPALAEDVELVTGEVIKGTVSERSRTGLRIEHPILGRLWVRAEDVKSVDGGPLVDFVTEAVTDLEDAAAAAEAAEPEPEVDPEHAWKFKVDVGASGRQGNGDSNDLVFAIEARQEDDQKRWLFRGNYVYADADDANGDNQKTKDKVTLTGARDFLLPDSPWFFYTAAQHEWDEFSPWTRRLTLNAGVGRELLKNEEWEVRARAGFGYTKEDGGPNDQWREEGLVGGEARWIMNDWNTIEANSFYFPDFEDSGEYRITSRLSWAIRLNDEGSLHLRLGLRNEYDSHRKGTGGDDFDRNQLEYVASLSYTF
jgi:putative salt-induced outer membrane protein YdiY